MALTILQVGSTLQLMDESGGRTTLTLPTDVTLSTTVPPRWAVYNRNVILVNTPSQPLAIDSSGAVRILTPRPPRLAPVLAAGAAGSLTGSFRAKDTFVTLDAYGNILSESDYSPISNKVAIAAKFLAVSNVDVSPDSVTLRRLYRTTDNGAVFFQWVDLDGNVLTAISDDLSDAGLSIFAAPVLGTPPRLKTIAEFRGRLFGGGDTDIDILRYTEAGIQYAWPADNAILVPGYGSDEFGITALKARREALVVGRRNKLIQITGTGIETNGNIDFDPVVVSNELGIESQETLCVFRDVAYFLWKDGVYTFGPEGVTCISDGTPQGKGNVRSWFATDDFFNRDKFSVAFAHIDPDRPAYRLFLWSADGTAIDRWVEYAIDEGTWFGPHKTDLFTPTSAFHRTNASDRPIPLIGGPASVFEEQAVRTDGTETAIDFDVLGKRHDGDEPDQEKFFGELSVFGAPQAAGVLQMKTYAGEADATREIRQNYQMAKPRQRLGRLGRGKHAQVRMQNAVAGQDVQVYGYEINPVHVIGRR